ncbi:MAG: O-antigen ligase family protein, partial [Bacteroidetes bacterium]|nr:O-antigen ligase family protein [Bacteroidota bacterium]
MIKSVIVFCVIVTGISLFQLFILSLSADNFLENIYRINATSANKNLLASILFLTLPFILNALYLSKRRKIFLIILLFIILVLILFIQSKAVIVALIVSGFIFIFLNKGSIITKTKSIYVILISTFIIIFTVFLTFQHKDFLSRITNTHTAFTRLRLWDNSVRMAEENVFLGVGAGNWQVNFPKYGLDKFDVNDVKIGMTTYQRPHNDFLWVLCETGIFGGISYLLIFVVILIYLFKLYKNVQDQENIYFYSSFYAAIVGYLLIAFVDFPMERIEHQLLLYLIFSIITAQYYKHYFFNRPLK